MLLHRQAQKTFPVWRQREALPCGLEALHQALTAQTSSSACPVGGGRRERHSTLLKWTPRRDFFVLFHDISQIATLSPPWFFFLFYYFLFYLITQLVLFFSCLIALALDPVEKLPQLIYTEQLFRPKAAAPFSQAPLCYPVSLLVIIRCFLLNAHCKEVVLNCTQQMMDPSERGFWKLGEPGVIVSKRSPSKRQVYPEVQDNQSWSSADSCVCVVPCLPALLCSSLDLEGFFASVSDLPLRFQLASVTWSPFVR